MTSDWILRALGMVAVSTLVGCGFWVGTRSLFPRLTERLDQAWRRPIRNTLIGALIGIPIVAAGQYFQQESDAALIRRLGGLLQALLLVSGLVGLSGLASRIGQGLKVAGEDRHSWKAVVRGGIVIGLVAGLPWDDGFWGVLVLLAGGIGCLVMSGGGKAQASSRIGKPREVNRPSARAQGSTDDRRGAGRPVRSGRRSRPPRDREKRGEGRGEKGTDKGADKGSEKPQSSG